MKGLERMVMIVSSVMAVLACQGCAQTGRHIATPVIETHHAYTSPADLSGGLSVLYESSFEAGERVPDLSFQQPVAYDRGIRVQTGDTLSTNMLYSSAALTSLAAERKRMTLNNIPREGRQLSAEVSLAARREDTGLGFDVGLAPRLSISQDGAFEKRRFGGELRIGRDFDKRGIGQPNSSWYLFAGADGEALVWEPGKDGTMATSAMALHDKVTVGDVQAGISLQHGAGQLSVSYIRREVSYSERNLGASETENFAGFTFTIRQ
ncbi:MAG: lipid A-modifier LpxR family protein [Pseudomonadota bacterium]